MLLYRQYIKWGAKEGVRSAPLFFSGTPILLRWFLIQIPKQKSKRKGCSMQLPYKRCTISLLLLVAVDRTQITGPCCYEDMK